MQKKSRFKTIIKVFIIILLIGGAGFAALYGYNTWSQQKARAAMAASLSDSMETLEAVKGEIKEIVSAAGVVKLHDEISVYANIESSSSASAASEKVSEVLVEVGDVVEQDQIIVTYDVDSQKSQLEKQITQSSNNVKSQILSLQSMVAPPTSASLKQLQSSVDSAEKTLFDASASITTAQNKISDQRDAITQAEKNVETAQQAVLDAEKDIETNQKLLDVGGISQEEFKKTTDAKDQAVTALEQTETSLQNAWNTMRDLEQQLESNQMNVATAQKNLGNAQQNLVDAGKVLADETDRIKYEQQEIQIENLQQDLTDYQDQLRTIVESTTSPIDGTVTTVNVSKGSAVTSSTVLMTIADFNDLIVKANISEYDMPKLALGQPVVMTSDGMLDIVFTGKIIKIGDSATTQSASSGTETVVPVDISLDNADGKLKPGFNLDLEIVVAQVPDAVTVPIDAVLKDAVTGEHYVFTIESERLKRTAVTLGAVSDMTVEIASGLQDGDHVIASPTSSMRDGMQADLSDMAAMENRGNNAGGLGGLFGIQSGGGMRPNGGGNFSGGGGARPAAPGGGG
ncbi:MAG: efflux RND transporter periplasmic adaptor subunit [Clostridiales bacterium]|jgi:HlyD family secretion protein|nr:efflux RND transporter periplasmic adaptor subunit [Clostridiales bacterium]